MKLTDDMKELLALFRRHGVQYAVVGGFAVNYYGYVRTTQDIDVLINPTLENADRVMNALTEFGFGGAGIPREILEHGGGAVHLGVEPNRIDILTSLKGVSNRVIFDGIRTVEIDGQEVMIISREHLVQAKTASDRPRDLADADELSKIGSAPDTK